MTVTRPRDRWIAAIAIGAATAYLHMMLRDPGVTADLAPIWWSARALLAGENPYTAVGPHGTLFVYPYAQLYPLPGILLLAPFTVLSLDVATSLFAGLGAGALAYVVARDGFARLPVFLSAGFIWSVSLAQWSPLLTAAALLPVLGFVLVAKPTIGLALYLYRPTRLAAVGGAMLVLASFAIWPTWPVWWLPILREHSPRMVAPIAVPGGQLLLLALFKWRRPEARLLLALAVIPQTPLPYESVVLFLVTSTLVEAGVLTIGTWIFAELLLRLVEPGMATLEKRALAMQLMVLTVYLPSLAMVLRRRNEGDTAELARALGRRLRVWRAPSPSPDTVPIAPL
jgi:hypothetical protein